LTELMRFGLKADEPARWRRRPNERWSTGRVVAMESDGSVRVVDDKGALLSLPLDRIEVRRRGQRGGSGWEPASERSNRTEQLGLL
jgi:hypothetical protein